MSPRSLLEFSRDGRRRYPERSRIWAFTIVEKSYMGFHYCRTESVAKQLGIGYVVRIEGMT